MKVKYVTINILIDARTVIVKDVMVHEVPLYKMKHGEGAISLYDRQINQSREIDDFRGEFDRLVDNFGYTSNGESGIPYAVALWQNRDAGGVDNLEKSMGRSVEELGLLRSGQQMPNGEAARTNDEKTAKIYLAAPKSKGNSLKKAEMIDALDELGIDFDKSMNAPELKIFGESALKSRADSLGIDTSGLGASDLFDAIVEAE